MRYSSLAVRFAQSSLIASAAMALVFCIAAWVIVSGRTDAQAEREAALQSQNLLGRIASIDELTRAQVDSGMRTLMAAGLRIGPPSIGGAARIAGKSVPNLRLGPQSQVGNFELVDHVKSLVGGTATLFAWDGASFTRVSTNVIKPDGSRAVGTVLDPAGKAFAALARKQPFQGVVNILGAPYITSYKPILDEKGALAGAWYTGYRLDSIAALGSAIEDARVLDHGFVALLKPDGTVLFHGRQTAKDIVDRVSRNPAGWSVRRTVFPAWNYAILTAYPKSDVTVRFLKAFALMGLAASALVAYLIALQSFLLKRQVLRPLARLGGQMANADLNTLLDAGHDDEIGELSTRFNEFVLRLRETLLQVRDGSAASTSKSGEIRTISSETVDRMGRQSRRASEAFSAVAQLSRHIAGTASHTGEASGRARAAADAARLGRELVVRTSGKMQDLARQTQASSERILTLTERARKIGSIVSVIEEIAAGTNLLALNASIEAARAGEHGRGFAVVAGEVRRLAERTSGATQQVAGLVRGIEDETSLVASSIDAARQHAGAGAEAVASLQSKFEEIAQLVSEVDSQIERIAQAAREESASANEVNATMQEVAASARDSARGAEQVVAASGELLDIANTLEDAVHSFRIAALPQDRAA
jgi:methyl-accepting chemotaxis protein